MGMPAPVDAPSVEPGKQGQQYDLHCPDQYIKHG